MGIIVISVGNEHVWLGKEHNSSSYTKQQANDPPMLGPIVRHV